MKKISKKLQTALLRGAVLLSGIMIIATVCLFCESVYALFLTLGIGASMMALIEDKGHESN